MSAEALATNLASLEIRDGIIDVGLTPEARDLIVAALRAFGSPEAARIEALEAVINGWQLHATVLTDRIEALEAALRSLEDVCRDEDHEAALIAVAAIARGALK